MLSDKDLQELLDYKPEFPVLSVYLNTNPAEGNADAYKLRLRSMLKEFDLPEDVLAITRYFDREHDWFGRSIAVFSSAPDDYLRAYSMAVPIRSRVRMMDRPYVKPIADLLDAYGGYGVVLVDKQGARVFSFHLGELREQEGMLGETVRHTKRGGGSQSPGRRGGVAGQTAYVEELAERNIKEAVDFATHFFAENNVRRILIGGTEDNVAYFRGQLPKSWQSLVVGTFPMSMIASYNEVLERAMEISAQTEQQRQNHLLNTIVTNAAKKKGAVIDLDETLKAIHEGRVQTLVYRDGYRQHGFRCQSCGYLSIDCFDTCQFCGGTCEQIQDAAEFAVRQVMLSGGDVEVIRKDQVAKGFDQIGALLRY